MSEYTKEINSVILGLGRQNITTVHLANDFNKIPCKEGYSNTLLFVTLLSGIKIIYRYNVVRKQFELWQGATVLKQESEQEKQHAIS